MINDFQPIKAKLSENQVSSNIWICVLGVGDMCSISTVHTFKSGYQTVSVSGGFSVCRRAPLLRTVGSFDMRTYRAIIDNHGLPFMCDVHNGPAPLVLQEDNCGPHGAKIIADYLSNEEVIRMIWSPQSPDLNLIQNVRGLMKGHFRNRAVHQKYPTDLFRILPEIWNILPDSYSKSLVASMPRQIGDGAKE